MEFQLVSDFQMTGRPAAGCGQAGGRSAKRLNKTDTAGVTGSGKHLRWLILCRLHGRRLVMCHNKTWPAQALRRVQGIFPQQRRGIFCFFTYDYYQPEAYYRSRIYISRKDADYQMMK